MPNRVIKESIRTSKKVNALSDFEFRLWLYLITYADDYGRGSADPELLKGLVFPRRRGITEKQIQQALDSLANTGMVVLYEYDEEPFFYFPNWDKHQRVQTKKSRFPDPADSQASPCSTVTHGNPPAESNTIQSESNTNTSISPEAKIATVLMMPLVDGSEYGISQAEIDEWSEAYPAVDVLQQLREMRAWCNANPKNKKTKKGVARFITGWLSKEQNRAPRVSTPAPQQETPRPRAQTTSWRDEPDFVPGWEGR